MKVIPFGKITDIIPGEIHIQNGYTSWSDLKQFLFDQYPALQNESFMIAINTTLLNSDQNIFLAETDEVSLLPPFSGG